MQALTYATTAAFALSATSVWAKTQLCSTDACLTGVATSPLLAYDESSSTYLLPGEDYPASSYSPSTPLNSTISTESSSISISTPSAPVGFTSSSYSSSGDVWSGNDWALKDWKSVYLPDGWYAELGNGQVLWGAIPERSLLPNSARGLGISGAGNSQCDPGCSSHGTCTLTNTTLSCFCDEGWTGSTCNECSSGYYGTLCQACPSNCTVCDDGYTGTGQCIGTASSSLETCDCVHGTCTSDQECICSAGWVTNSTVSASNCNTCAEGFFQDAFGDCLACPLGCTSCTLQSSTNSTASCTSCSSTLSLSTAVPATCTTSTGSCSDGTYYDSSTSSCESCSPACSTCTGPSTSDCLACASPRVHLQGSCVGYDASTGVCDSALTQLDGMFVVNNAKSECDACPVGCASCKIPSFSSAASYDTLTCQSCNEGYLLEDGKCVKTCTGGYYLPEGSATTNGTCQQCDSSCTSCVGTSTTCTSCPTSLAAQAGSCISSSSCPSDTIYQNGTCTPCPLDCTTCSSMSTCASCPTDRPVLKDGRCLPYCAKDTYWDSGLGSCQACDWTCASCVGSGNGMCSTCPDGSMLKSGECVSVTCNSGGFASGFGICLSDFLSTNTEKYLFFIFLAIPVVAIALAGWWYVRRERRKTREATKEFGDKLDESQVHRRLAALRLEKVFGFDRVSVGRGGDRSSIRQVPDTKQKSRLRELLLPSKKRQSDVEMASMDKKSGNFAPDRDRRYDSWGVPILHTPKERDSWSWAAPPPYAPSAGMPSPVDAKEQPEKVKDKRDSLDSIPTPTLQRFPSAPRTPLRKSSGLGSTVIHSMSSPSPEIQRERGLMPPPRPGMSRQGSENSLSSDEEEGEAARFGQEREREGKEKGLLRWSMAYKGQDNKGTSEVDVDDRLRDLWPALGGKPREREGYI
ncbi:hypothetical protein B9479_000019 [Cryptococcus floricola]|uniref:EGF-like domain-containing protein n=1 Tax=Cryptococcus floricola TaxID=2591691 RepID=A0A5D3B9X6_9TREE|nr:hypothetical protein B9479_000019 [Cryptococcus floricola]